VIAVRFADFPYEAVGAQQAELAADRGGTPAILLTSLRRLGIEQLLQVSIPETMDEKISRGTHRPVTRRRHHH